MENTMFIKKFIAKFTIFAILWWILSPLFHIWWLISAFIEEQLPQILVAAPVSPIYATNTWTIVNLSFTWVKNGDILFYDYWVWGDPEFSFTWEVILNKNDFVDYNEWFYDLKLNFWDKFLNYTWTGLKLHVDIKTWSGESASNNFEYNHEWIEFISQVWWWGWGWWGWWWYSTWTINIIDSTHISLSGSLDFLWSQSWDRFDTYGPPTHYFFTEVWWTELVRISYNFTGSIIEFPLSMSGKTVQIWWDFSSIWCNQEPTNCTDIKLTTSWSWFTNGSFTFPGEQNEETFTQTWFILSATWANTITSTQTWYVIDFTLSGNINQWDYLHLDISQEWLFWDLFWTINPDLILSWWQLSWSFNKAINFSTYTWTWLVINLKLYQENGFIDTLIDTYSYNVNFQQTTPSWWGWGGGWGSPVFGGCGRSLISPTLTYTGKTLVNQNFVIISWTTPSCWPDIVAFYNNGNYIGTWIVNRSNSTQTGIINYEVQLNEWINNITAKEVSWTWLSESSNIISITKNSSYQIATPTNVSLTWITQTWGTLSWTGTGWVESYEIYLNGTWITSVNSGTTSFTFDNLQAGKVYYVWLKAVKWNIKSSLVERRLETLWNNLSFNITFDNECIEIGTWSYKDWMSLNISWSGFYYNSYASKEINSNSENIVFNNVSNGEYAYSIWAWKCGYQTGTVSVNWVTNKNITISAGKFIKTIVRENSITWSILWTYNIEMIPNTTSFDWNDAKYVYVQNQTGTVLQLANTDYKLTLRDNSWTPKNIIWIFTGATQISNNSILENTYISSWDTITIVVKEWNVLIWNANIWDGYISLYASWSNTWIAGTSIRNGKFALVGIPNWDYKIEAYSYNYKFENYTENLNISSDILSKNIIFTQKNISISADFSKNFALEWKSISLKINPNQNSTWSLSFASGSDIIASAKYKVLNGSWILVSSGVISDWNSSTSFTNLAGKTITVDVLLKNNISSDIKFLNANFNELELSLPIVRIEFNSPATTLVNTNFTLRWSATSNAIIHALYNGEVIATGATNANWVFEVITQIATAGSGMILVKDISNNIVSEWNSIAVWSDIPVIQSYDIKSDDLSVANSNEWKIKYFSVWAKWDLTINSKINVSAIISNNPTIKYFVWWIELTNWNLSKWTYIGYGTKDIVVEYTKNGTTYTQTLAKMIVLIDPAWYVYNKFDNTRIPGIQATLYELQDKNGNRVTATWGLDSLKLSQYTSSGYTKDDILASIDICKSGDLYPCSWEKYDSTWLWNEANPQITDNEWKYAWMTPEWFYYVAFKDINGTTNGSYDDFDSLAVHIPPEVTDLNVGTNFSSWYTITENSTNYDRSKSWTGTWFTAWSYTCKNAYTGNTCETAPVNQSTWWWWGGWWYIPTKTTLTQNLWINTTNFSTKMLKKEVIKEIFDTIQKDAIQTKYWEIKFYKPQFNQNVENKINILTKYLTKKIVKKSKKEQQKIMNQYSIVLIWLKLHQEKDSRWKTIAKNAILKITELLK